MFQFLGMTDTFAVCVGLLMLLESILTRTILSKDDFVPEISLCLFTPSSIELLVFKRKTNTGFALLQERKKMSLGKTGDNVTLWGLARASLQ